MHLPCLLYSGRVRICTLALAIDVCLLEGHLLEAKELFLQAQGIATQKLSSAAPTATGNKVEEDPNPSADGDEQLELETNEVPQVDEAALRTDGMPSWLSPRQGHLVALLACHVPWRTNWKFIYCTYQIISIHISFIYIYIHETS